MRVVDLVSLLQSGMSVAHNTVCYISPRIKSSEPARLAVNIRTHTTRRFRKQ